MTQPFPPQPPMVSSSSPSLPLNVLSTEDRTNSVVVAGFGVVIAGLLVVVAVWQLSAGISHRSSLSIVLGIVLTGAAGGAVAGLVRWMRRCGAWLDGTVLRTVGMFTTTWYDLATADVWAVSGRPFMPGWRGFGRDSIGTNIGDYAPVYVVPMPLLRIRDVHTGLWTQLPLRGRSGTMQAPLLRALADAVDHGPRPQPQADQAHAVAIQLRNLAARSPWA